MKEYTQPNFELLSLQVEDVITESFSNPTNPGVTTPNYDIF